MASDGYFGVSWRFLGKLFYILLRVKRTIFASYSSSKVGEDWELSEEDREETLGIIGE